MSKENDGQTWQETAGMLSGTLSLERQRRDPLFGLKNFFNFPLRGKIVWGLTVGSAILGAVYGGSLVESYVPEVLSGTVSTALSYTAASVVSFTATHVVTLTPLIYERYQTQKAIREEALAIQEKIEKLPEEGRSAVQEQLDDILSKNNHPKLLDLKLRKLKEFSQTFEEASRREEVQEVVADAPRPESAADVLQPGWQKRVGGSSSVNRRFTDSANRGNSGGVVLSTM